MKYLVLSLIMSLVPIMAPAQETTTTDTADFQWGDMLSFGNDLAPAVCEDARLACKQTCWDTDFTTQSFKAVMDMPRPDDGNISRITTDIPCYNACDGDAKTCAIEQAEAKVVEPQPYAKPAASDELRKVCEIEFDACETECDENDASAQALNQLLEAREADSDSRNSIRRVWGTCMNRCNADKDKCLGE